MAVTVAFVAVLGCSGSEPGARSEPSGAALAGIVEEAQDAPPYTYIRVRTAGGTAWAAVPLVSVRTGSQIRIVNGVTLKNFDAPGLRRFEAIVFGVLQR